MDTWTPTPSKQLRVTTLDWQADALCAQTNPEAFNLPRGANATDAKRICAHCEVTHECLTYALTHHVEGIWAGTSDKQRRKLKHHTA